MPENYVLLKDRIFKIYHAARIGDFSFHFGEYGSIIIDATKCTNFFRTGIYDAAAKIQGNVSKSLMPPHSQRATRSWIINSTWDASGTTCARKHVGAALNQDTARTISN